MARIGGVETSVAAAEIPLIGSQRATVVLIARRPGSLDGDPAALDVAISRVALELVRARAEEERRARLAESVFHVLAGNEQVSPGGSAHLGVDLEGGNAFVAVDGPPRPDICRRVLIAGCEGDVRPAAVFENGGTVFALLTGLGESGPERRLARTAAAGLTRGELSPPPRIAFAGPHHGPVGAQRALAECRQALQVLRLMPASEQPTGFEDLGIWTLLASANREQLRRFRDAILAPLIAYDARRRSQLMETLRALVAAGFNWRPASAALAVHPNTVRYRMSVITKLTGLDLASYGDQVKADVAVRITELLGSP
ncbi:MAG TPA: helix-turn-helix domain-containing protein [Solirubrobacteraceae bacterium]|nr:helix-turn-helix domain-containing protein [Solirubrobacteraceae bacterium]